MRLVFEIVTYCVVYILAVKLVKGNNPQNCLFFYPTEVRERMYELGLANKEDVIKKKKVFFSVFVAVMLILIFIFIVIVNRRTDFVTTFKETFLILALGNWFDGIVIDRFWVSQKSWIIPETVDIEHVKTWKTVITSRAISTICYIPIVAVVAFIFVQISKLIWILNP